MQGRAWWAAGLVALVACRQQVFEPVRDGLVATARLDGDVRVLTRADVLFVIDDSPSMENEQAKLAAGFPALLAKLEALDPPVDYRVAVMTTSVDEHFGPCDPADPGAAASCSSEFGGAGFACESGACVRRWPQEAGRLVAKAGNPTVLDRALLSPADLGRMFSENVRVGLGGSRQEQPLRAFRLASDSGRLAGFLRNDARLVLIVASDEDDCSDSSGRLLALEDRQGSYVDHCAAEAQVDTGRLDGVEGWVRWFEALDAGGQRREVAIGAIVGLAPGTQEPGMCVDDGCARDCRGPAHSRACAAQCQGSLRPSLCASECADECVSFCGSQSPGRRTARAVRELGGTLASICEPSFGPALARLARVLGIPEQLDLPSVPVDDRAFFFTVTRAGTAIECVEGRDFSLDAASNPPEMSIDPHGACRLLPGDHWSIRYLTKA